MNRNHRKYSNIKFNVHSAQRPNKSGVWKFNDQYHQKRNAPRINRGTIDIIKLMSALGINDPGLEMIFRLMKSGSTDYMLSMLSQMPKKQIF